MKVLYTVDNLNTYNSTIDTLRRMEWVVDKVESKEQVLLACSTGFYDVLIIDATIEGLQWIETIKTIRDKQIFTPMLIIADEYGSDSRIAGLEEGADMCMTKPFQDKELILRVRVLKRRNTNYQSPTISFEGINLNRPDGKIYYENTSLSVSAIEIELFRLLTRATEPIRVATLAEKIKEPEEKIVFFAQVLQKKIGLLGGPIELEIKNSKCKLIKKIGL